MPIPLCPKRKTRAVNQFIQKHSILACIASLILCMGLCSLASANALAPAGRGCTTADFIDADCDGYGVASPKGPDADDRDPAVNTPASALAKYGKIETVLKALGYLPDRVLFVSTADPISKSEPRNFGSWEQVSKIVRAGDCVLFRGTQSGPPQIYGGIGFANTGGTPEKKILVMAFPGERVALEAAYSCIGLRAARHLVFDGFQCSWKGPDGRSGVEMHFVRDIALRNIETFGHKWGIFGAQDWQDVLIENSVIHDNSPEHGIYVGARDLPNARMKVRRCLLYRNYRHGFQSSGRMRGLVLEENVIHSNALGGVSLINGVREGRIARNVIFNNNKQGIILYAYREGNGILPFGNTDNVFAENVVWIGKDNCGLGTDRPASHAAVLFNDASPSGNHAMSGNVFRDNILVTYDGPVFQFDQASHMASTTLTRNQFYQQARVFGFRRDCLINAPRQESPGTPACWNLGSLSEAGIHGEGNVEANPEFRVADILLSRTPGRFDFRRRVKPLSSPAEAKRNVGN